MGSWPALVPHLCDQRDRLYLPSEKRGSLGRSAREVARADRSGLHRAPYRALQFAIENLKCDRACRPLNLAHPPLPPPPSPPTPLSRVFTLLQEPAANGVDTKLEEERDPETYDDSGGRLGWVYGGERNRRTSGSRRLLRLLTDTWQLRLFARQLRSHIDSVPMPPACRRVLSDAAARVP